MMTIIKSNLLVFGGHSEDFYRDVARINKNRRGGIGEGAICKVSVGSRSKLLVVRGIRRDDPTYQSAFGIKLDSLTREILDVDLNRTYDFEIKTVGLLSQIKWAAESRPTLFVTVLS